MSIFEAINDNRSVWDIRNQIDKTILEIIAEKNEHDETAFIFACKKKQITWVDFLLSLGANPNDVTPSAQNALQLLIDKETPLVTVSAFIEAGLDVNYQDKDGQSVLFYALNYGKSKT